MALAVRYAVTDAFGIDERIVISIGCAVSVESVDNENSGGSTIFVTSVSDSIHVPPVETETRRLSETNASNLDAGTVTALLESLPDASTYFFPLTM